MPPSQIVFVTLRVFSIVGTLVRVDSTPFVCASRHAAIFQSCQRRLLIHLLIQAVFDNDRVFTAESSILGDCRVAIRLLRRFNLQDLALPSCATKRFDLGTMC